MMVLRFANSIFEPIWNYKYIDHVQITVSETLGVEKRGGYYDKSGALRDMVQNHLFQLMALVAMEPPAGLDATNVRDEKVKVFRSVRPFDADHLDAQVVRGQYGPGEANKSKTAGYTHEEGVPADSKTETFVALKLFIDNWRWSGTPFYLRTGKFLPEKLSEVVVRFRSPPLTLFQKPGEKTVRPDDLVIRVQPEEGITWRFNAKVPGGSMNIQPVNMDMLYKGHVQGRGPRGVRAADRRRDRRGPDAVHPRRRGRGGVDRGRPRRPRVRRRQGGPAAGVRPGHVGAGQGPRADRARRPAMVAGRQAGRRREGYLGGGNSAAAAGLPITRSRRPIRAGR